MGHQPAQWLSSAHDRSSRLALTALTALIVPFMLTSCGEGGSVAVSQDPLDMSGGVSDPSDQGLMGGALSLDQGSGGFAAPDMALDQGPTAGEAVDMGGQVAGTEPDPDELLEAWRQACELSPTPLIEGAGALYDQSVSALIKLGGPLPSSALLVLNPSEVELDETTYLTLKGGRVERLDKRGQLIWVSEARGLTELIGAWDLNGDGSLELIVRGLRHALVLQLSTGRSLWTSPERLHPDGPEVSSLALVRLFESGPHRKLYLADSGCGSAGSGDGALFDFSGALSSPELTSFDATERLAGRCPAQHSYHESPEREGLMMIDSRGLHLFDAHTGARALCGAVEGLPLQGNTELAELQINGRPAWLLFTPDELILVREQALEAEMETSCPPEASTALLPVWRRSVTGLSRDSLTRIDLEADGAPELLITSQDERGWLSSLLRAETGELIAQARGVVVLGALSVEGTDPIVLSAERGPSDWPEAPQRVQLSRLDSAALLAELPSAEPLELTLNPLWAEPLDGVTPLYSGAQASQSAAHRPLLMLNSDQGPALLLKQSISPQSESLLIVDERGVIASLDSNGPWRGLRSSCQLAGCLLEDAVTIADAEGQLLSYDAQLTPLFEGSPPKQPTGGTALLWLGDRLITRSGSGALSAYGPPAETSGAWSELWRVPLGAAQGGRDPIPSRVEGPSSVVAASAGLDPLNSTWLGYEVTSGVQRWSHSLPLSTYLSLSSAWGAVGAGQTLLFRHERLEEPSGLEALSSLSCDQEWLYSDLEGPVALSAPPSPSEPRLFTQRADCPNRPMRPQVIHALEVETGRCVWRALLRPSNDCYGPSGQSLSFVDHVGGPSLYLTETSGLRRFDPATGELLSTQPLAESPLGQRRGGGRVQAVGDSALRYGGNAPPELYPVVTGTPSAPSATWRLDSLEGLRDQSWLYRKALSDSEGAWVSVGSSLPLARLSATGELSGLLSLQGVLNEEAPIAELSLGEHLLRGEEVRQLSRDPNGELVIGTLEGGLYVIQDRAGEASLELSRYEQLDAPLSDSLWVDWDQDGRAERLIAHEGGQVLVYQHSDLESPLALWVARCDREVSCEGEPSLEEPITEPLMRSDALCYAWLPLEGLSGAELQLREEGGLALTEWREAPLTGRGTLEGLSLLPGSRYRLSLRAWIDQPEGRLYTAEVSSALFSFEDRVAPQLELSAQQTPLVTPVSFELSAADNVQLSGWSADIYAASGVRVRSLGRGSLSAQTFSRLLSWDGSYATGSAVPSGSYELRVNVVDSSGLTAEAIEIITVE